MNNAEHKFKELRNQLDQLDTAAMQQRIATNLRSAWKQSYSHNQIINETIPMEQKKWNWRMFSYIFGGIGLAGIALITTLVMSPDDVVKPVTTSQELAVKDVKESTNNKVSPTTVKPLGTESTGFKDMNDAALGTTGLGTSISDIKIDLPDFDFDPGEGRDRELEEYEELTYDEYSYDDVNYDNVKSYGTEPDYTYTDDGEAKQVFSESVALSIEVKDTILDVMTSLRSKVTELDGYLVSIAYYDGSGTLSIQLPAEQLSAFEEQLKQLDVNHEIEVNQYNVQNVSSEVVAMDEYIKFAEDQVIELEEVIASNETSEADRADAKEQLEVTKEIIEESKQERDAEIAKYNLINVTVQVTESESFWEGNYYQYDRSTFSGMVKYEFGKAVYSLIRSTGKVTAFFVWLAVYSVIFVPAFYIIRGIVRKIRNKISKK